MNSFKIFAKNLLSKKSQNITNNIPEIPSRSAAYKIWHVHILKSRVL